MKKNREPIFLKRGKMQKLYKIMKLSVVLMIVGMMQVSAAVYSQNEKITVKEKNISLSDLLWKIQNQTDFVFTFNSAMVEQYSNLTVKTEGKLEDVLKEILKDTDLDFKVTNGIYVINKKAPVIEEQQAEKKITITGTVKDEKGDPLPFAAVCFKGTTTGCVSAVDGTYKLEAPDEEGLVLEVSSLGFVTQEIPVEGRTVIHIVMVQDMMGLDEVVVTGFQTIKKEKLTGSVVTLHSDELEARNVTNLSDNLEGMAPGLVRYNDKTTIRGTGTLNASEDILLVVDGLPVEGSIDDLNPYDIASMTVLKDAAATAIYGARASNGVIVVVTKGTAGKQGVSVELSANFSYFDKPDLAFGYMTPSQQVDFESNYYNWYINSGDNGTVEDILAGYQSGIENGNSISPIQYAYYQNAKGDITDAELKNQLDAYKKNNFIKEYTKHALQNQLVQQYNMAIRHGGEKAESNFVVNFQTDNAGIINAKSNRLNLSYKGALKPVKWFEASYGLNMVIGKNKSHYDYNATTALNVPSYYSLFNSEGTRAQYALSGFNIYSSANQEFETTSKLKPLGYNHLDELNNNYSNTTNRNSRYFIHLNFKPIDGLSIKPQFQYEDNITEVKTHSEEDSYTMRWLQNVYTERSGAGTVDNPYVYNNLIPQGGRLYNSEYKSPSYTFRTQVDYEKEFGRHFVSVIAGTEFRQTKSLGLSGGLFGYDDQLQVQSTSSMDFYALSNVMSTFWNAGVWPSYSEYPIYIDVFDLYTETKHRYASGYANLTYSLDGKYNIFASARKDYADLFGGTPKYRGKPLWSAGVAWNISKEKFMEGITAINYLKLRASYGVTGNIATNYTSRLTASITGTQRYTNLPIATIETPPNDKLRWEKTATTDIGFDVNMLDYRLRASFDWYRKEGTDLLAEKRLDVTQGYTTLVINNGDMLNNGIEISLGYDWIRSADDRGFNWSTTLNYSHNKNEITNVDDIVTTPSALAGSGSFIKGRPVNSLFSYQYKGLTEGGIPQFMLSDGTLTTGLVPSSDMDAVVFSGSADPTTSLSFNNVFEYKGISLTVFGVYYGGHYFRDNVVTSYLTPSYGPMPDYLMNSWTPDNTNTLIPGSGQYYQPEQQATSVQLRYADTWVKKADFFKIRNIVVGYQLPKSITDKIKAQNVQLRFQVDNPGIMWTKDDLHDDPETGGASLPTSYILGLNLKF